MSNKVNIVHLYANEMNIYGDNGNVLILSQRLNWRGIKNEIVKVGVGDNIPVNANIIIGGGGQDAGQTAIANDLQKKKNNLISLRDSGVPMLMICGMYQMFGRYFKTKDGDIIEGISVFDAFTVAGSKRIIGNIVVDSQFGKLIGYENHSGCTYLEGGTRPIGVTNLKQGNNGKDKSEGAVLKNVYGSYLHGPILAKAPLFADDLLQKAINSAGLPQDLEGLNDTLAEKAANKAISRPR